MEAIRAPRGTGRSCQGWVQEAAQRMLMNNLDPDLAERPEDLVVYGGTGKAARDWDSYHRIVASLRALGEDETLLVQSGKPVGVLGTHPDAPRVLIANSNLVPRFATWEHFWDLERRGLIMYGQMTAGSWIYIGTQGILQGTYETFAQAGRTRFGTDDLAGRLVLSGRLGGWAARSHRGDDARRGVPGRRDRSGADREAAGGTWTRARRLDDALRRLEEARRARRPLSVGLVGNAATVFAELARRGIVPDLVTDQTSAHDPLNGYVPADVPLADAPALRRRDPEGYVRRAKESMARQDEAMLALRAAGSHVSSTTATTCASAPTRPACCRPSTSRVSCRPTSGRCSARVRDRSAGWRSPAIHPTSPAPTRRSRRSSRRTRGCAAGSTSPLAR
jgi:urocanate hydratase